VPKETDQLTATFAALAVPTRRAILARLAGGEATVNELAAPFEMTLPAVSKHLKVLERAGLIERGRSAQWRPARLRAEPLKEAADWVQQYRRFWEESLERLGAYLRAVQDAEASAATNTANSDTQTNRTEGTEDHDDGNAD
jgi:DNA-binding transcriptional ArsR family regulator